jgi:RHS repeat-associated protein
LSGFLEPEHETTRFARYTVATVADGDRTRIDEAGGAFREYTYDDLYRLTGETVTKAAAVQYAGGFTYDAVGNRLSQTKNGVLTSSSYDERDRLLSEGVTTYGWDDEGNLGTKTGADGAVYDWDFDHRLKKVTKADGAVVEHLFDADGVRVQTKTTKAGASSVQNYLVDTSGALSHVVAETDEAGALKALYVRGDDLQAVIRASGTRYVHADGLGSIRKLTDESGAVTDSYTYNAFGELLEHVGSDPQPYMFAGEAWEGETGLYYNRARWLDVGTGRFVSEDPWRGTPRNPGTLGRYAYVLGNPVTSTDPTGRWESVTSALMSVALVATVTALALGGAIVLNELQRNGDFAMIRDVSPRIPASVLDPPILLLSDFARDGTCGSRCYSTALDNQRLVQISERAVDERDKARSANFNLSAKYFRNTIAAINFSGDILIRDSLSDSQKALAFMAEIQHLAVPVLTDDGDDARLLNAELAAISCVVGIPAPPGWAHGGSSL